MARRRKRRRRSRKKNSFYPLLFRLLVIAIIGGALFYFTRPADDKTTVRNQLGSWLFGSTDRVGDQEPSDSSTDQTGSPLAANERGSSVPAQNVNYSKDQTNRTIASRQPAPDDGVTAHQIFANMRSAYRTARTYSDQAKIIFSYRKSGAPKREARDWNTTWDRPGLKYSGQLCQAEIKCDGQKLSCYNYHIDTKNFDGQQLVLPVGQQIPIRQLLKDGIARQFIGGSEQFPLDPQNLTSIDRLLLPPAVALLNADIRSTWLDAEQPLQRFSDQQVDGQKCYRLVIGKTGNETELLIDQQTSIIRKMIFPTKVLAPELVSHPEITEPVLEAEFRNATFRRTPQPSQFVVELKPNARPVTEFITFPESLPSEKIGQRPSHISLQRTDQSPFKIASLQNQITTMMWLENPADFHYLNQAADLIKSIGGRLRVAAVLFDRTPPGIAMPPDQIQWIQKVEAAGIPVWIDRGAAWRDLEIQDWPTLVVFGRTGKIQYSERVIAGNRWKENLKDALNLLVQGNDVAADMIGDYHQLLANYDQKLIANSAAELLPVPQPRNPSGEELRSEFREQKVSLTPNEKWTDRSFEQPGNVLVLPRSIGQENGALKNARFLIFDGYQTVRLLGSRGELVRTARLDIPVDQGVSLARINDSENPTIAVFQKQGKQVHFFDTDFKRLVSFPNADDRHAGISDCRPLGNDGSRFLISFLDGHGVQLFDVASRSAETFADIQVDELGLAGQLAVGAADGKIVGIKSKQVLIEGSDGLASHFTVAGKQRDKLLAVEKIGPKWSATRYSSQFKKQWSVPLDSQLFDSPVSPMAVVETDSGEVFWATVDSQDVVCLISDRGTWLGDFKAKSAVHGLALSAQGRQIDLIVATADRVVCWALNYQAKNE